MSTAGKVLTVLILMVMVAWIIMSSAVTQLNVNWQQKIATQVKQYDDTTAKIVQLTADAVTVTELARAEQANKDRDLREVQGRTAAIEARRSAKIEDLSRIRIQLADYEEAVKKAEINLATRKAEKVKTKEKLATTLNEVSKKQDENSQLRDQLAKLQNDFIRLLTNNAKSVNRAGSIDRVPSRSTSNRRPSPAS